MKLLRLAVDTLCWGINAICPIETLPSLDELADQLAESQAEPQLTPYELIAIRQLIEERFPNFLTSSADGAASTAPGPVAEDHSAAAAANDADGAAELQNLNADELHYAASAIRCWVHGTPIDGFNPHYFAELADRLSAAALELTPITN